MNKVMIDGFDEVAYPMTVCDTQGIIVYMNRASIQEFESDGGVELLGKSLLDCHPEPARAKLTEMLAKQIPNTYISRAAGKQYFVHETPWFEDGEYKGFVEISIEITNLDITK
jgi:transcriptional regulator with PAS, ATPase and Fis domain